MPVISNPVAANQFNCLFPDLINFNKYDISDLDDWITLDGREMPTSAPTEQELHDNTVLASRFLFNNGGWEGHSFVINGANPSITDELNEAGPEDQNDLDNQDPFNSVDGSDRGGVTISNFLQGVYKSRITAVFNGSVFIGYCASNKQSTSGDRTIQNVALGGGTNNVFTDLQLCGCIGKNSAASVTENRLSGRRRIITNRDYYTLDGFSFICWANLEYLEDAPSVSDLNPVFEPENGISSISLRVSGDYYEATASMAVADGGLFNEWSYPP